MEVRCYKFIIFLDFNPVSGAKPPAKDAKGDKGRKPSGKGKDSKDGGRRGYMPFRRTVQSGEKLTPKDIWDYRLPSVHKVRPLELYLVFLQCFVFFTSNSLSGSTGSGSFFRS